MLPKVLRQPIVAAAAFSMAKFGAANRRLDRPPHQVDIGAQGEAPDQPRK
jgi:hypothetical protein